jgi:transcriptional regulator with XRE-family HTH domain
MQKEYNVLTVVGNNLRTLRNHRNLSQLELSSRTGLSHTFINNIENGKKWISAQTLEILCRELDAYPFEFFLTPDIPDQEEGYRSKKIQKQMILELDEMLSRYKKEST